MFKTFFWLTIQYVCSMVISVKPTARGLCSSSFSPFRPLELLDVFQAQLCELSHYRLSQASVVNSEDSLGGKGDKPHASRRGEACSAAF